MLERFLEKAFRIRIKALYINSKPRPIYLFPLRKRLSLELIAVAIQETGGLSLHKV